MNETFVMPQRNLSHLETARLRQELLAMRDELANRSGALDRICQKQVHDAVRKLEQGGFGVCEACARPIPRARLIARPYVRYCLSCL